MYKIPIIIQKLLKNIFNNVIDFSSNNVKVVTHFNCITIVACTSCTSCIDMYFFMKPDINKFKLLRNVSIVHFSNLFNFKGVCCTKNLSINKQINIFWIVYVIALRSLILLADSLPIQHRKITEILQNNFTETLQYCIIVAKRY